MNTTIKLTLALSCLVSGGIAMAADNADDESISGEINAKCSFPGKPGIPNGRNATEDEMVAAMTKMKEFQSKGNAYLSCLDDVEAGWGDQATDEQKQFIVVFHNRAVDEMQSAADLFNQAVRAFKGKKQP